MAIPLTILPGRRVLPVEPGTTILKAAHGGGVDITATCGGRGRCTSCRVKLVAGTAPPPTIMDELQLGDALVREGYRLSCQWPVTEPVTVQIAPPLDETTFQILGGERPEGAPTPISIDAGIRKRVVHVALPKDEHLQTSDLEALLAATGDARRLLLSALVLQHRLQPRDPLARASEDRFAEALLPETAVSYEQVNQLLKK